MSVKAVALKREGTHPPWESVLARFADLRSIRSLKKLEKVKQERPDIILKDLRMPRLDVERTLSKCCTNRDPQCSW
jgi:CheY-like chemotaxis protein